MTLKDIYQRTSDKDRTKQKRRSGLLWPLVEHNGTKNGTSINKKHRKTAKSKEDEKFIRDTLVANEFLKNILTETSLQKTVDCMYLRIFEPGDILMKRGEMNSELFLPKTGSFEIKNEKKRSICLAGRIFGDLAILHSVKANETVKALTQASVWILDCIHYKNLTINSHLEHRDRVVKYLKDVPAVSKAPEDRLYSLCDIMHKKYYPGTNLIVKEGDILTDFFIVTSGIATILSREKNRRLEKLTAGCFFGDIIFQKETVSLYTIIADPAGVECLVLSRRQFLDHFHDLDDFLNRKNFEGSNKYDNIELKNLKILKTLGIGGYGRVELVQDKKNKDNIFALKLMKKYEISGTRQIEQVYSEKNLQMACNSEFIVKLYRTFRDPKFIYFLLEPCLGGDLWNLMKKQRRKCFDTDTAKFYAGCVLEAFNYLHSNDMVYRDLKPENVMLSANGYVKVTDFGFAKTIGHHETSCSFVGTAEYVSPELIQNLPHDKGVDYWALGVFIFELLVGKSPFRNSEHNDLKTYKAILKGIDFVSFPHEISPRARNLIKKLCRPLAVDRIGCQKNGVKDIQKHPWFSKLNWDKLKGQELEPPIKFFLNSKTDTRYFDTFKEDKDDVRDDFSTWDQDF